MRKHYVLGITALLVSAMSAVHASDWTFLGSDEKGNSWFVDKASLLKEGNLVKAWKRIEFKQPQPYPPNKELISSALFLDVTNCIQRQVGVKASKLLREDGSVITAHEDPDAKIQWQSAAPDTLVEKSMNFVCSITNKSSEKGSKRGQYPLS